ncbi:phosphoribosylglycinamide synthetase C domain-containing protein [Vreelandella olivaria]|uniref:phosphoribosylglycinamide synthetase C domain-containing protein n=1 Tax=Vreelandella olivaria TaxID=390919 RepID=UPI00201F6364
MFNGAIYLGLRVDASGKPHLIEINARMGDSESEVIFPRVKEDLSAVFTLIAEGGSDIRKIETCSRASLAISLVTGVESNSNDPAKCWPTTMSFLPQKIDFDPTKLKGSAQVFWANVTTSSDGRLQTGVGRIAHISALGATVEHARREVYSSRGSLFFKGVRMRCDIGGRIKVNGRIAEDWPCALHKQYHANGSRTLPLLREKLTERPIAATAERIS